MMEYKFVCQYCGNTWKKTYYYKPDSYDIKCEKCTETKNIEISKIEKTNYYD